MQFGLQIPAIIGLAPAGGETLDAIKVEVHIGFGQTNGADATQSFVSRQAQHGDIVAILDKVRMHDGRLDGQNDFSVVAEKIAVKVA